MTKKTLFGVVAVGVLILLIVVFVFVRNNPPQSLKEKARVMQEEVSEWVDQHPTSAKKMDELLGKFDEARQQKNFEEAERLADEILALMGLSVN